MLPFLRNKQESGASQPIESLERKPDESKDEDFDALKEVIREFVLAVKNQDVDGAVEAFKAACEIYEGE